MSNDDIALSFDTAEYYNLQEACDYLNRKHKTDNITPKKLLKHIYSRNINTFIHFRMDNLSKQILRFQVDCYGSNIFTESKGELEKFDIKTVIDKLGKVESYISDRLLDELYMGYILFKIDSSSLFNMSLNRGIKDTTQLLLIDGFVHSSNLNDDPSNSSKLKSWSIDIDGTHYYFTDIGSISIVIDSINDDDLAEFNSKVPFPCKFDKRDSFSFPELNIRIDDIIILHKDLLIFEKDVFNNKFISDDMKFKPRKGVSNKKVLAKEIAKHIAAEQWLQDTKNMIKIGEMCNIVWAKLIEYNLSKELPNHIDNLRPWIKEVAPEYASEAGRPKS